MKKFFLSLSNENKGFIFGFVGIITFSITPSATTIALGYHNSQLSAEFITFGRSALAGNLALLYLIFFRKKIPKLKYLFNFSIIALCLSLIFPLALSFGLIYSTSIHSAVILAFLPLATAIFASFYFKQRASKSFWLCAILGGIITVIYILVHNENLNNIFKISHYDILFFIAVIAAAVGYNFGTKLTKVMTSVDVISWALVIVMPFNLILAIYYFPKNSINIISWLGFLYTAVFSQWIGFFVWYKGLSIGGAVRISQIQLLMPFFTIVFSIYFLEESINFFTITFLILIVFLIFMSRKMSVKNI